MIIKDFKDCNAALGQISIWLKKGVFSQESFGEIEGVISAVENYMGMPLPAKGFIESNCND